MEFLKKADYAKRLYRDMGYNLFPVNGKNPPCVAWKRWATERVSVEQFIEWSWRRFVSAGGRPWKLRQSAVLNWAIPTGLKPYSDAPALVVIDSDDAEAEAVVAARCPDTPAKQQTPGKGWHRVYRRPAKPDYIPIRQGTVIGGTKYKIDLRADMGYILAPGSVCPKRGTRYEWTEPWTPEMFRSLPVYDPDWLPDERKKRSRSAGRGRLTGPPACLGHDEVVDAGPPACLGHDEAVDADGLLPLPLRVDAARRYLARCRGAQQGKGADNYCFALAMALCWGFALPAGDAHALLSEWGLRDDNLDDLGGYYPWSDAEVWHKVDNACHTEYDGLVGDRLDPTAWLEEQAERFVAGLS